MRFQNHNAWHLCRDRDERVACVASAMRRLGEGCTAEDLKLSLGITQSDLDAVADDARSLAVQQSTTYTRITVPALWAA